MLNKKHIGSSLDDFLQEEGHLEEARIVAVKRVLARQIEQVMKDWTLAICADHRFNDLVSY